MSKTFFEHIFVSWDIIKFVGKADHKTMSVIFFTLREQNLNKSPRTCNTNNERSCQRSSCDINGTLNYIIVFKFQFTLQNENQSWDFGTKGFWDLTHRLIVHIIIVHLDWITFKVRHVLHLMKNVCLNH